MRKVNKYFFGLIILFVGVYGMLTLTSKPIPPHPFLNHEGMLVMAHRGGRGLWPENTLYAFEQAAKMGVDILEMDIRSTDDDALVAIHDSDVDRTTNGTGPVHRFNITELKELDAGYNWTNDDGETYPYRDQGVIIPTLEEVFTALPHMRMAIEIKQAEPSIVIPFCQMIQDFGMTEQVLISSFYTDIMKDFRRECPGVATAGTIPEVLLFFVLNKLFLGNIYHASAEAIEVSEYVKVPRFDRELHVVTSRFVAEAHKHNMEVHIWTVNEQKDMQRFLDIGVDGIFTDYPDRLLALLGRDSLPKEKD